MTKNGIETEIADVPLNVVEIGKAGDPLIVMHGWGQTLESMRLLGDLLGKFYHVYLVDLPGFGQSPKPPTDWDTVQYANRIQKYIEEKHLSPAHVLGHSFGGRVAIRLASHHPEACRTMILINAGGLRRTLKGKRKLRAMLITWLNKFCKSSDKVFNTRLFDEWFVPRFASLDYKNAGALRNILVKAVNEDVSSDAAKIEAPSLMLWGELDEETPAEIGQRLHELVPNSKLVVMPSKDHFPFLDEGAHLCASYIVKFLDSAATAPPVSPAVASSTSEKER